MPAACGIACEVCGGLARGLCPMGGCAPGKQASSKLEVQRRALGFTCPILECAHERGVDHCSRDCPDFPCEIYYKSQIPYSPRFLDIMKKVLQK
ncbi:MAG: hypothetical protein DRJ97_08170 [Thermoprotei archaeon]|nr:MAG: hypothetical protein DRJ97_08170 [Thermoprotei archaeon]